MEQPPRTAPTPITKSRRAQIAEIAALRRENDRLSDPELPDYVRLCGTITKGMGWTADQRIDFAGDMYDFAESRGMPMSLTMCEAFFEHIEARALACVGESRSPAIILAFRTRGTLS
jgi:hypothetical protein